MAGAAILIALGAWIYAVVALRRERQRRHLRVQEAVWQWAGQAATKEDVARLRETVEGKNGAEGLEAVRQLEEATERLRAKVDELAAGSRGDSRLDDLRHAISELSDRVITLEAERGSTAEGQNFSRFPGFPRS